MLSLHCAQRAGGGQVPALVWLLLHTHVHLVLAADQHSMQLRVSHGSVSLPQHRQKLKWAASAFNGAIELPDGSQVTLYVPQPVHLPGSPAAGRNNAVPEAELCLCWLLEAASVGE